MGRKNKNKNRNANSNVKEVEDPKPFPHHNEHSDPPKQASMQAIDNAKAVKASDLPPSEPKVNPQATVQSVNPGKIESNVKGAKAAAVALEFILSEFKDKLTPAFWEGIRDAAIERVGIPLRHPGDLKAMTPENAKEFEKELMDSGRYEGKSMKYIYNRFREYYLEYTTKPDLTQKRMRRYHLFRESIAPK